MLSLGDAAETDFLKSLQVDPQTITPVTVMMAPPVRLLAAIPTT